MNLIERVQELLDVVIAIKHFHSYNRHCYSFDRCDEYKLLESIEHDLQDCMNGAKVEHSTDD